MTVGKLESVKLKEIWAHEAKDFTTWLADNLDVLDDQLSELELGLDLLEVEKKVGSFNADILATTSDGALVIIENQLGKTDHSHMGQILTYAVNADAKVVLWLSPKPRPEHVRVISWLSDNTPIAFFLVQVRAFRIGESKPAPLFTLISSSDADTKDFTEDKKKFTETQKRYKKFWSQLLEKSNEVNPIFASVSPPTGHWIAVTAGMAKTKYLYQMMKSEARAQLLLQSPSYDDEDLAACAKRFEKLAAKKEEIEAAFGGKLIWDFKENRKGQHVTWTTKGNLPDEESWSKTQEKMVDAMDRLATALKPHLKRL